jgi:hypothetical protein
MTCYLADPKIASPVPHDGDLGMPIARPKLTMPFRTQDGTRPVADVLFARDRTGADG